MGGDDVEIKGVTCDSLKSLREVARPFNKYEHLGYESLQSHLAARDKVNVNSSENTFFVVAFQNRCFSVKRRMSLSVSLNS